MTRVATSGWSSLPSRCTWRSSSGGGGASAFAGRAPDGGPGLTVGQRDGQPRPGPAIPSQRNDLFDGGRLRRAAVFADRPFGEAAMQPLIHARAFLSAKSMLLPKALSEIFIGVARDQPHR